MRFKLWRVKVRQNEDGTWAAQYRRYQFKSPYRGMNQWGVSGCQSREEALEELKDFVEGR